MDGVLEWLWKLIWRGEYGDLQGVLAVWVVFVVVKTW